VTLNNKPKYHLFKNTQYALEGFIHAFKTESSFKLELLLSIFILPAIFLMGFELWQEVVLVITLFLVLIVELLNSAVENVVDLVTKEIHPLAKSAKDIGATAVMFSIILHIVCWGLFLLNLFGK
jgi:diacylglycerol kinase (ATP)